MILAIDTSGPRPVVAAADPAGALLFGAVGDRPRSHAEELAPLVARAMAAGHLHHVVAGRGPGAFTGLRVGLVTAQVLGWARHVPVTGISSMDVVAEQSGLADGWVVMDARRGELYCARYAAGRCAGEPRALARAAVAELVGAAPVAGDTDLLHSADRRATGGTELDPAALARVAARAVATDPGRRAEPDYLRRPDVTLSPATGPGAS